MSEWIGWWVRRDFWRKGAQELVRSTRSHLVESEIADRFVTRCGRQMRRGATKSVYRGELAFTHGQPADACKRCVS